MNSHLIDLPASRSGRVAGYCLLGLALLFYYGSVLRLDILQTKFVDLIPHPDATEYFAQATSLLRDGVPTIQIGHDKLPSRYPPGYPILMLPWLLIQQQEPILAPYRTNQTIGLLLICGCFVFYQRSGQVLAGGIASLLLATQPALVSFARSNMSELSAAAAAVLAVGLIYYALKSQRRWPIYAAAVVLGLAVSIRLQMIFFAPLLIGMAWVPDSRSRWYWWLHCAAVLLVFAAATSPVFLLNWAQFGNPLKTGYDYWVSDLHFPFSWQIVPAQLALLWSEATASWTNFNCSHIFGTGSYFVPAFALLALIGLFFCRANRFTGSVALAGATYFIGTLTYLFLDMRFYLPLQFLLIPVATLPVVWAIQGTWSIRQLSWRIPLLLLFVLVCAGYPSESGYKPQANRSQTWDALHYTNTARRRLDYEAVQKFVGAFGGHPGKVISTIDPVYLNSLLPPKFIAAPVNQKHSYSLSASWHYGEQEAIRFVTSEVGRKRPVYALLTGQLNGNVTQLPPIPGFFWRQKANLRRGTIVMILLRNPQEILPTAAAVSTNN